MLHGRKLWWVGILVLLLLALSAPAALAQGIINGSKAVWGGNYTLPSGQTLNGDLTVFGGNATLDPNSTVNGNLTVMGGNVTVQNGSTVGGKVTMFGGTVEIAGRVTGDVGVVGGMVNLAGTAVVSGNINTLGGTVRRAAGAVVGGSGQGLQPATPEQPFRSNVARQQSPRGPFGWFFDLIWWLFRATGFAILLALIGAVVLLLAPRYTGQVATTVAVQPALNFAAGLLTLVLAFLVGIPLLLACGLGLLVWLAAILVLLFGWIAVGLWVGQRILGGLKVRAASSVVEVVVGVFLITWLAWILPCLGWLFGLVLGSIGVGAVLLTRFGTQPASGLSGLNWGSPLGPAGGPRGVAPVVEQPGRPAAYTVPPAPAGPHEGPADITETANAGAGPQAAEGQQPLPPADQSRSATTMTDAGNAARPLAEPPAHGADSGPVRSLEHLEAVSGITPEIADRLRAAGSTTLVALATADPATLAEQAGVSVERVRDEDWIGQARRLLG